MDSTREQITIDHITYIDDVIMGETSNERLLVIARQEPKNDIEFKQAQELALYWYNIYMYGCKYNVSIHRKLKAIGYSC